MCVTLVMQVEISEAVSSQRAALEDEHRSALEALQQQVVALEKQHSAALVEITDHAAAKEKQHEQQTVNISNSCKYVFRRTRTMCHFHLDMFSLKGAVCRID